MALMRTVFLFLLLPLLTGFSLLATPVLNTAINHPSCSNLSNGDVTLTASLGTAPYTYQMNGGAFVTTNFFDNLAAGTYTFTVKDATNATATVSVTLTATQQAPSAAFTAPTTPVCMGAGVALSIAPISNGFYTWNFNGGTILSGTNIFQAGPHTVSWASPGTKTVTLMVTQGNCSASDTALITVNNRPSPIIDPEPAQCLSGNAFTFSCQPPNLISYLWSFGSGATPGAGSTATPASVTYATAGTKQVVVQAWDANGCAATDTLLVNVDAAPSPAIAINGGAGTLCAGQTLAFSYGSSGTVVSPSQTYQWTFTGGAPNASTLKNPGNVFFPIPGPAVITLEVTNGACSVTISQPISILSNVVADAGLPQAFCEGSGGVAISGTASGGQGPYSYTWTSNVPIPGIGNPNAATTNVNPTASPTASGPGKVKYYLVVQDAFGCASSKDSVEVRVKAVPRMSAGGDRTICGDAPGQFLQGGVAATNLAPLPIALQWVPATGLSDPNSPTPFADPASTQIYTLVGTSDGCSSLVSTLDSVSNVTVLVVANPIVDAGLDVAICPGGSVALAGATSGSGTPVIAWSPAAGLSNPASLSPQASPVISTTYILTVAFGQCYAADTVTVNVNPTPTLSVVVPGEICFGDSAQLTALVSPAGSSVFWTGSGLSSNTGATPKASPFTTTAYTATAKSPAGCVSPPSAPQTLTVLPVPVAIIAGRDTAICFGSTLDINGSVKWLPAFPAGASQYSLSWSPTATIQTDPQQPKITVLPQQSTRYLLTTTSQTHAQCFWQDSIDVSIITLPHAAILPGDTTICSSDTLTLYLTGMLPNTPYSWSPAAQVVDSSALGDTVRVVVPAKTTFRALATVATCQDSAKVTLNSKPGPSADYFTSVDRACRVLSLTATQAATDAVAYVWEFGDGTPNSNLPQINHTYATPGQYPLRFTAIGPGGCRTRGKTTLITVEPGPQAMIGSSQPAGVPISVDSAWVKFTDLSGGAIIDRFWEFGDGTISDSINPLHQYRQTGTYSVVLTVTDSLGCRVSTQFGPIVVDGMEIFIPNILTPNNDGKNDTFAPAYYGAGQQLLIIFDRWGRELYRKQAEKVAWDGRIQGDPAPGGVYFYYLEAGGKVFRGDLTLVR